MSATFFSIVMPTYNRAAFLPAAILSVFAQTFKDWELIVVDDGSTDNTKQVVLSFKDPRIKYLFQTNSERSAARNNGINRSSGQYICFLDSDDYYLPEHLENLHKAIIASGFSEAVFITDVVRDENGKLTQVAHEPLSNHLNNVCFILCSDESVIPARVCIHRSILENYKFNPGLNISEDAELFTRIGAKYPFIQVREHSVVYHLHEDNSTNRQFNPYRGQLKALQMIFGNSALQPLIPLKIKNEKLSKCWFGIARYHQHSGEYLPMVGALLKSIALNPGAANTKAKVYMILTGGRN